MYLYHWLRSWLRILSNGVHGLRCGVFPFRGSNGLGCYGGDGLGCWLDLCIRIPMLTLLILDNQVCQANNRCSHLLQHECQFGENVLRNFCSEGCYFIRWHACAHACLRMVLHRRMRGWVLGRCAWCEACACGRGAAGMRVVRGLLGPAPARCVSSARR